jgi:hypothetical protein
MNHFAFIIASWVGTVATFLLNHGLAALCGIATLILTIEGIKLTRAKRKLVSMEIEEKERGQ